MKPLRLRSRISTRISACLTATICIAAALTSCIASTTVEEINNTVNTSNAPITLKSDEIKQGTLVISIQNNADNTLLTIDSLTLCNVLTPNKTGGKPKRGNITIFPQEETFPPIQLPTQTITPWTANQLPRPGSGAYITIHGKLHTNTSTNTPYLLYQGAMYTPFSTTISEATTTTATITLYPNCPLYIIHNGTLLKILQEITFMPFVWDWE